MTKTAVKDVECAIADVPVRTWTQLRTIELGPSFTTWWTPPNPCQLRFASTGPFKNRSKLKQVANYNEAPPLFETLWEESPKTIMH